MTDPAAVAAELAAAPGSAGARAAFAALDEEDRRACLRALKQKVDETVRARPPDARPLAEELVELAEPLPDLLPLALRGRAVVAHFNGENDDALPDFERAIELYEAAGEEVEAAVVHTSLVEVCHQLGRAADAHAHADHAREVFRRRGETRSLAQLECNAGNVHMRQDDYPRCAECYEQAQALFESLEDPVGVAYCRFNLGVVQVNGNRLEEAVASFTAARAGMDAAGHGLHVADCDYHLAWIEARKGQHGAAIEGLERARRTFEEVGKPSGPALCDLDLAEVHLLVDARRDALAHALRGAARFEELGLVYELARCEVLAAMARARLGEPEAALADLERASARFAQLGNDASYHAVEVQRAGLELEAGRPERARDRALASRAVVAARGLALLADLAALVAGRAALATGDADAARAAADELLDRRDGDRDLSRLVGAEAFALRGRAHLAGGDALRARADLEAACAAVDATWSALPRRDLRAAYFREHHSAFVDLAWLLSEPGADAAGALSVLERGRERGLLEAPPAPPEPDPDLAAARARLEVLLTRRLETELSPVGAGRELRTLPAADAELLEAQREVAALSGEVPRSAAESPGGDPAALAGALQEDETGLCFLVGRAGIRCLLARRGGVEVRELEARPDEVRRLVARLQFHLEKTRHGGGYLARRGARRAAALEAPLAALGAALLEPVAADLATRDLVIVPHGVLHDLPFHALRVGGEPLIERHDVAYAHSLGALSRTRTGEAPSGGGVTFARGRGAEGVLPAAGEEEGLLRRLYGDLEQLPGSGTPGESLIRAVRGGGGILHAASHGLYEPLHPAFSSVRLGEGFLFAHDVQRMRLPLSLVTLAGCETGRSRRLAGEDHLGLVRAFLDAGARAVLGTLWPVEDGDAAAFAAAFYSRLAGGEPARRAVAEAQRELRTDRPEPLSWAPFALHGDPDLRFPAPTPAIP